MALESPRTAEALFGSRTRAAILGYLAGSKADPTGYRIAADLAIGVSKAYPELRRLEAAGVVGSRRSPKGAKGFFLTDEDLRRFLVRRVRIVTSQEWFSPERLAMREANVERARGLRLRRVPTASAEGRRPFEAEVRRPPEKDKALARFRRTRALPR